MRWVRLEDIAEISGGGTPKTKVEEYWNGDIVWLSPTDLPEIGNITKVSNSTRKITQAGLDSCAARLLPIGSVIYSSRASIGKIGINEVPLATNQGFINFICGEDIYNKYLAYTLKYFSDAIVQLSNSTTFKEVSRTALRNFKIPLPSLSEQKAIVAKLDRAQRLIDIDREMLAKYDDLIQSVFLEMFGDPVTNPKGWEVKNLESMIELVGGGTPSRKNETYWGDEISWATVKDLKGDLLSDTQESITKDGLENSSSKLIPAGNLIICSRMNVGKVMMNSIDVAINQDLKGIFIKNGYDIEFIFYYLKSQKKYFEDVASGATVKGIKLEHIKSLKTPVPDSKTLKQFKETVSSIRNLRDNYLSSLKKSEELFSSLVQKAFR